MTKQATSVAELKTYGASMSGGDSLEILGYYAAGDGGGGTFYWDATSTDTDNGGTIIQATGVTTGRWLRVYSGAVNVLWFGVDNTGITSCSTEVQAIFDSGIKTAYFPDGTYYIAVEIDILSTGGLDTALRDISIKCERDAIFTNKGDGNNIFNISGQRRFNFTGGKFVRAANCFHASGDVSVAYSKFVDVLFEGAAASHISRCYRADTSIGVVFDKCKFGTDQIPDQIDIAVEFTGVSAGQSNINIFNDCSFVGIKTTAVKDGLGASAYRAAVLSMNNCWFELINGYALDINFAQSVSLEGSYFETCGDGTNQAIRLKDVSSFQMDNSFIAIQNGDKDFAKIEASGVYKFGVGTKFRSTGGTSRMLYLDAFLGEVYSEALVVGSTPFTTYEDTLYSGTSGDTDSLRSRVNYKMAYLTSTTTDEVKSEVNHTNYDNNGVIFNKTNNINLVAQDTFYDIATIKVTNASHSFRVTLEIYQIVQGVGHTGRFEEYVVHWNGAAYIATSMRTQNTIAGFVFQLVSVDANTVSVQLKRTTGLALVTPASSLISLFQASNELYKNPVYIVNL